MKNFLPVFILLWFVSSCAEERKKNIPPASGLSGDMYIIMESTQWEGSLGKTLDTLFQAAMSGLPRKEPIFNMRWIDPLKLNFVLKQRRNLIIVLTLNNRSKGTRVIKKMLATSSLKRIKKNTKGYAIAMSNIYAKGQEIMLLYGKNEEELIGNILQHGHQVIDYFNKKEEERLSISLFKSGQVKGISQWLQKKNSCDIKIPFGYALARKTKNFLWARQINPNDDKNIFIAQTPYRDTHQFKKDSLIAFRDRICKKYLYEDPDLSDSFLLTETTVPFVPIVARQLPIGGSYATELRGLWRTNNFSMGGPFVGYALVNNQQDMFYYVEGFVFSPSKNQREIIRELETILHSFKTLPP